MPVSSPGASFIKSDTLNSKTSASKLLSRFLPAEKMEKNLGKRINVNAASVKHCVSSCAGRGTGYTMSTCNHGVTVVWCNGDFFVVSGS